MGRRRFEARKSLKSDPELYAMMQLADSKHCWLSDLDSVPAEELYLWIAFHKLEEERRKREEKKRK